MARAKLRRIVVDGQEYLWRFTTSSKRDSSGEWKCHDEFVAYATGCVQLDRTMSVVALKPYRMHIAMEEDILGYL